jgi:hypothetical protein
MYEISAAFDTVFSCRNSRFSSFICRAFHFSALRQKAYPDAEKCEDQKVFHLYDVFFGEIDHNVFRGEISDKFSIKSSTGAILFYHPAHNSPKVDGGSLSLFNNYRKLLIQINATFHPFSDRHIVLLGENELHRSGEI